jgi:hypothetical protein
MADREHIAILKRGASYWKEWREQNPAIVPDLRDAELPSVRLFQFDLNHANLSGAVLRDANLFRSTLKSVTAAGADFTSADLTAVDFESADLGGARLTDCILWNTVFRNTNLAGAVGLTSCKHRGGCTLDAWTVTRSVNLPQVFLVALGFSPVERGHLLSLQQHYRQYCSCFVSYSSSDREFVLSLCQDLRHHGVPHFFAPEDLKIGARIRPEIHRAIYGHDKLLLVLSRSAVESRWVEDEVERSLEKERATGKDCIFPVRIDDAVFNCREGWATTLRNGRHIGDFEHWREPAKYAKSLTRLIKDLRIEENIASTDFRLGGD